MEYIKYNFGEEVLRSKVLKLSIFATGLAGIVAEYILSTLATYFLGDSIFQWTLILSIMLFSMGLGSRLSRKIKKYLAEIFILIELCLSLFCSFSSLIAYSAESFTSYTGIIIYTMAILIGMFIGMEIPLVIRLNQTYESLRVNISNVMEKDYYGSLVGGLFFAFIGLPYLGLTYTPFVLGLVNFTVALFLFYTVKGELETSSKKKLYFLSSIIGVAILVGVFIANPVILYGEQHKYVDKVVYAQQTKYQRIVITKWKDHHWLFLNGNEQLSTLDEVLYHEPLVHTVMQLHHYPQNILVLGGGDGCAVREVLKYPSVDSITLVDLDPAMTELALTHPVLTKMNENSLSDSKVRVINQDGFSFIEKSLSFYDVIIIDLPDPKTVELSRLYSKEFYTICKKQMRPGGVMITQSGSPYYAARAYKCIEKTFDAAGLNTLPLHNQIPTLGEWGWVIGSSSMNRETMKNKLLSSKIENYNTKWINKEAMSMITSFGKDYFLHDNIEIEVNQVHNPVLYHYYLKGNWGVY
ncbi:MAG: polyamine aminopropyltransferase [Hyphomicrobiales bacterium]